MFAGKHCGHQEEGNHGCLWGCEILYQDVLHTHKDPPHIPYKGYNWAAITIRIHGGFLLNLITSYTKHGHELEALGTFTKVREFIDTFTIPYVWGGDFNRPPGQVESETAQNGLGTKCLYPRGVLSTCSNSGLIDDFVSHVNETDIIQEVEIVRDAPTSPHYPVRCMVPANIKDTMVK